MSKRRRPISGAAFCAGIVFAGSAHTAVARTAVEETVTVGEVVVTADKVGLLERRPTGVVFGLDKPLIETPRSASFVSDTTLDRYGILTLDKLTAVSPGTYTASFFGVAGSVEIRGTLAENYFRGFKRIENRGTYSTPVGDAAELQIVRGPPSPIFGPGKVGGRVNFIPKTAQDSGAYLTHPVGEISLTGGGYDKKLATGQFGVPLNLGAVRGGVYAYGEVEDSGSFYRGIHPAHELGEVSVDFDLGGGWSTAFGGMIYNSTGDVQTPGWNRVTQDLIDHQTYITGRNTVLVDSNHDGRLEPTEISLGGTYPIGTSLYKAYFGFPLDIDPRFVLDTGVGTTKLDPRTVFVSRADFSNTTTDTAYLDIVKDLGANRTIKLQQFYDRLSNARFVSYGFPAEYRAWTEETRLSLTLPVNAPGGLITSNNLLGAADRYYRGEKKETFNSGLISLDRRDLSFGPTPTDVFDSPFNHSPGGLDWEIDVHSRWNDIGVFETSDITIGGRLNLILGGRYDHYTATSQDTGIFSFETPLEVSGAQDKWTYTASASYKLPWGFMPYVTYDRSAALEIEQAGDIRPANIQGGAFVSNSTLAEAGVKFQLLNKTLIGSLDIYRQTRTQLSGLNSIVQPTVGKGFEYEFRYLATNNLSFTLVGDFQHTEVIGPDKSVYYIPPADTGTAGINGYGGAFLTFDFSQWGGKPGNYSYSLVPHAVSSLFATYSSDDHPWGRWGATAGVTYASKTSGITPVAVTYPAYELVNMSLFFERGPYDITLNIDNLFDKLYFTPDQGVIADIGVLPGRGREWRLTIKRRF
ncbi:MAG: TonB-dependent receptor [Caulobacteraceae bacterium]|nr:TonB-dependent receptor [Caulobacteraceae bacterium]